MYIYIYMYDRQHYGVDSAQHEPDDEWEVVAVVVVVVGKRAMLL